MRGVLANDLFVAIRSSLAPVAELLAVMGGFEPSGLPVAADVVVAEDPRAPRKRFFLDEYYTQIEWRDARHAEVRTNGATGSIEWSGRADEMLRAELRIYPEGAPESLGMFLRLLTSLLLPSRNGTLAHASAVVVADQAVLFLGDSGAGKTTTARRIGREGALRIADDLAILRVDDVGPVMVEPCRFDRGGRLPGREGCTWPVRAAYDIRKGAERTEDGGIVSDPLVTWCAAILSSTGPPDSLNSLLTLASTLRRIVPPHALRVSPSGAILPHLGLATPAQQYANASSVQR